MREVLRGNSSRREELLSSNEKMTSKNLAVLCVFLLRVFLAGAQTSAANGTIGGIVLDPQAVPVTGASVSLLSADEGFSREATVTSSGKFILPALPAGSYILQVHGEGLETRRPVKLTLGLNANLRLTLKLSASAAESQMTVRSGSPTQEGNTVLQEASREEADLTTSLAGLTVTYLPSRDRELAQLTQQTIGVAQAMPASGWVMLGQRASQTSGAVDGAELRDPFYGGLRGAQDSFLLSANCSSRSRSCSGRRLVGGWPYKRRLPERCNEVRYR